MDHALKDYRNHRSLELILDGARWGIATIGHWIVIWLLAWVLSDEVGRITSFSWAGVISTVLLFQASFALYWRQEKLAALDNRSVRTQLRIFTISAWAIGFCWAAGGIVLFPENNREMQLFLVFVMGGMSLAAVGTQHVYLPAC